MVVWRVTTATATATRAVRQHAGGASSSLLSFSSSSSSSSSSCFVWTRAATFPHASSSSSLWQRPWTIPWVRCASSATVDAVATETTTTTGSVTMPIVTRRRRVEGVAPSPWSTLLEFPASCVLLLQDCFTYLHIEDAAQTAALSAGSTSLPTRNAWTHRVAALQQKAAKKDLWTWALAYLRPRLLPQSSSNREMYIPRRQRAFQRRLERDLSKVAVTVAGYVIVPVAGNLFAVLAVLYPRYLLSRHFWTPVQRATFAQSDYLDRARHYEALIQHNVFDTLAMTPHHVQEFVTSLQLSNDVSDLAGPLPTNVKPLVHLFLGGTLTDDDDAAVVKRLLHPLPHFPLLSELPKSYTLTLAYATNAVPQVGVGCTSAVLAVVPELWIIQRLVSVAKERLVDDLLLLKEGSVEQLTAEELVEACEMRGYPTTVWASVEELQTCLRHHLQLTRQILQCVADRTVESKIAETQQWLGLLSLTLHLPAIRSQLKKKEWETQNNHKKQT